MVRRSYYSRGELVKLRKRLAIANRAKHILEARRDQLIGEVYALMKELERRRELETRFKAAVEELQRRTLRIGRGRLKGYSYLVEPAEFAVAKRSLMGVTTLVPRLVRQPSFRQIPDPDVERAAVEVWRILLEFVELASKEKTLEETCAEVSRLNRIVNAIDRKVIPSIREEIRLTEAHLEELFLEEASRTKMLIERLRGRESWRYT